MKAVASVLAIQLVWLAVSAAITRGPNMHLGSRFSDVAEQMAEARRCLGGRIAEVPERLAAVYLHTNDKRDRLLVCSISKFAQNVASATPADIYIFVVSEHLAVLKAYLAQHLDNDTASKLCFLPMSATHTKQMGEGMDKVYLGDMKFQHSHPSYLKMGRWRMLVPFQIMHELGYEYTLQVDDDLFALEPMKINIVQKMRKGNITIANHRLGREKPEIMLGLPELARYYLASNNLQPGSSLLQHIKPSTSWQAGLHSPGVGIAGEDQGFDRVSLYGNFLILSTKLWADPKVQDFMALCLLSGGMERHRWQEQAVFTFVWLLFTDTQNFWLVNNSEFRWLHSKDEAVVGPHCKSIWSRTSNDTEA